MGQEDEADVVWLRPVEAGALHDEDLLLAQQLQGELLVVADAEALHVQPRKEIQGALRLHATDAFDVLQERMGEVALFVEPPTLGHQGVNALGAAQRRLNRMLRRHVRAQAH